MKDHFMKFLDEQKFMYPIIRFLTFPAVLLSSFHIGALKGVNCRNPLNTVMLFIILMPFAISLLIILFKRTLKIIAVLDILLFIIFFGQFFFIKYTFSDTGRTLALIYFVHSFFQYALLRTFVR